MFGYVKPDKPYLYVKDETLYNALYCQVCKSIGKKCGQFARFSLTYDIAFLSAIVHNATGKDVKIERKRCIAHPVISRPIALRDEISDRLGELNIILTYYKLTDDVLDDGKHRAVRAFFSAGYKRARKKCPELDEIVKRNYEKLRFLEKSGEKSIDKTADPFAVMLVELSDNLLGRFADDSSRKFFYHLGKWIYLIDALDDYDKDVAKNNYNPFVVAYGGKNFAELKQNNGEEIAFIMSSVLEGIKDGLSGMKFRFNADLIKNIAIRGTFECTKKVLSGEAKGKKKE